MLCAVIPAYNEERYIADVIRGTLPYVDRLVVVDDGSSDRTLALARSVIDPKLTVLRHRVNLGKGAGLKTGCLAATRLGASVIVTLDADGQHPPEHIPGAVRLLTEGGYDVVFSIRSGGDRMPTVRRLGNWVLNTTASLLFHLRLRDMWCGFRVFQASVLPRMAWRRSDYSGEIEMALRAGYNGLRYSEYVIPTVYHDAAKGVTVLHGLKLLGQMIIWRLTL